ACSSGCGRSTGRRRAWPSAPASTTPPASRWSCQMSAPTAIVAEDEPVLRGELIEMLADQWPELVIAAEAADGEAAARLVADAPPAILFLDIEMPGLSGLEVARRASGRCHV